MLGSDQVTLIVSKDTAVAMTLIGAEGAIKKSIMNKIRAFLVSISCVDVCACVEVIITCFVGLDYKWVTWLTDTSSSECIYDDGVVCEWIQVY